jgi:hypothetical protein
VIQLHVPKPKSPATTADRDHAKRSQQLRARPAELKSDRTRGGCRVRGRPFSCHRGGRRFTWDEPRRPLIVTRAGRGEYGARAVTLIPTALYDRVPATLSCVLKVTWVSGAPSTG